MTSEAATRTFSGTSGGNDFGVISQKAAARWLRKKLSRPLRVWARRGDEVEAQSRPEQGGWVFSDTLTS